MNTQQRVCAIADLEWFFNDAATAMGEKSSFDSFEKLCMAGIPDGGTVAQVTQATMEWDSPVFRWATIDRALADDMAGPVDRAILKARFTTGRSFGQRSMLDEDFKEFSGVVAVAPLVDMEEVLRACMISRAGKRAEGKTAAKATISRARVEVKRAVEAALNMFFLAYGLCLESRKVDAVKREARRSRDYVEAMDGARVGSTEEFHARYGLYLTKAAKTLAKKGVRAGDTLVAKLEDIPTLLSPLHPALAKKVVA